MEQLPSILSAIAATLAAILSFGTLYVTGRREHRRWLRDSLVEAYVEYVEASFATRSPRTLELRAADDHAGLVEQKESSDAACRRAMTSLTRLRLIAPREVVAAAEQLHFADVDAMTVAFNGPVPPDETWHVARRHQQECRDRFIGEVRKSLGVGKPADISPGRAWRYSPRSLSQ
ncbi:hypothetical protein NONI108955_37265 [Nocardia ninae]|uniref:Uncharacterized protein n=2 Tax=Nocardia ninae TaxID=356145 RepID=A0A511M7F9_9NOCA|nr:hypothetical protein [Nocardia ninae]GEM36595.1 hypothetical protein NN4_11140 [Nocardia ninae NBRC 108245]